MTPRFQDKELQFTGHESFFNAFITVHASTAHIIYLSRTAGDKMSGIWRGRACFMCLDTELSLLGSDRSGTDHGATWVFFKQTYLLKNTDDGPFKVNTVSPLYVAVHHSLPQYH